jgi:hypothetical protein
LHWQYFALFAVVFAVVVAWFLIGNGRGRYAKDEWVWCNPPSVVALRLCKLEKVSMICKVGIRELHGARSGPSNGYMMLGLEHAV